MRSLVLDPTKLSQHERRALERSQRRLSSTATPAKGAAAPATVRIEVNGQAEELPATVAELLVTTLNEMARGHAVQLSALEEELTTVQAARLLGVSRPFLTRLLEEGKLPYRSVGTHRRVRRSDVLAYDTSMRQRAHAAADELINQAQELGLGY